MADNCQGLNHYSLFSAFSKSVKTILKVSYDFFFNIYRSKNAVHIYCIDSFVILKMYLLSSLKAPNDPSSVFTVDGSSFSGSSEIRDEE